MKDYLFYNTAKEAIDLKKYSGRYNLYLLCRKGQVCFHVSKKRIEANSWDLVVWPSSRRFDDVSFKEGTDADVLLVSDYFLNLNKPETPWDVPGSNYLKTHPVLPLVEDDFDEQEHIGSYFRQIKVRTENPPLIFEEEVLGTLLRGILYDIWTIVDRVIMTSVDPERPLMHFGDFLYEVQRRCVEKRDVASYAEVMQLTPKYLTELSNNITGRPASDWIDYYAARIIRKELSAKTVSFTDIAHRMKFSSLPAFTRYVNRVLGCSPTEFRESLKNKRQI